ncbi:MAG: hypothetical protein F6K23_25330 [Okeania sp. SIO2C9]|uniref:hypothetical protein n=1 Tax=Okeania sp. SIO2C9 TaxID=2607791 RepID=UPI0013C1C955|nr:hypothetical protein [Okeania sp. SIO2C9]NEQ76067.1 hypothetical protein [Okeania sp. SIO2C9]
MSYSEFTLSQLEFEFNLILQERVELFKSIKSVSPSALLREILAENIPLVLEIDTEKARFLTECSANRYS